MSLTELAFVLLIIREYYEHYGVWITPQEIVQKLNAGVP